MALIGRLIREARLGATELHVRPQDVGPLVEHVRGCIHPPISAASARECILSGHLKMAGVPVRVMGN